MGRKVSLTSSILNLAVITMLIILLFVVIPEVAGDITLENWLKKAAAFLIITIISVVAMAVLNVVSGIMLLANKNPMAKGLKTSSGVLHIVVGTLTGIGMISGPFAFVLLAVIIALAVVSSLYFIRSREVPQEV